MKKNKSRFMKKNKFNYIIILALTMSFVACNKKEVEDRGLTETALDASFTITTVNTNNFIARVKDSSYIMSKWDIGNGGGASVGKATFPIFLPDAGTYAITHYAVGK